jgi:mannose PTS system EIIA component
VNKKGGIPEMVGAVIVAHSFIGKQLISTAKYILGKIDGIVAVTIDRKMDASEARNTISGAIERVDRGGGVLILTDLSGGSPSTTAFSFLNKKGVEVITGVNLPMILTYWNLRQGRNLMEIAKSLQLSGRRSIVVAKNLMETRRAVRRNIAWKI